MDKNIIVLLFVFGLIYLSSCVDESKVDYSFCGEIDWKDENDNCTDGLKHPIHGNCTHYYKCDGFPSGVLLKETETNCDDGEYFDINTLDCIKETQNKTSENCDQIICQNSGLGKIEENQKYKNQGSNQGGGQRYSGGEGGGGDDNKYGVPSQGSRRDEKYPPNSGQQGSRGDKEYETTPSQYDYNQKSSTTPPHHNHEEKHHKNNSNTNIYNFLIILFFGLFLFILI